MLAEKERGNDSLGKHLGSARANDASNTKTYWALRHELMHWKHGDPVANAIRNFAQFPSTARWRCIGETTKDSPAMAFAVSMKQDGSFRIDTLPQGNYLLEAVMASKETGTKKEEPRFGPLTVPTVSGGPSDDPFDAGTTPLKPAATPDMPQNLAQYIITFAGQACPRRVPNPARRY